MADPLILSLLDFDDYLTKKLIPYVSGQYQRTKQVQGTLHQLVSDMIFAVDKAHEKTVISYSSHTIIIYITCSL